MSCERELSLVAVNITESPPFDVVIVADNSDSLSWSREDLAAGLQDFLGLVPGRNVRFFVLTPTQYGASSAESVAPRLGTSPVRWQDPATLSAYSGEMTDYTESCVDALGAPMTCPLTAPVMPWFSLHGEWTFAMPDPVAVIDPTMSADEVAAQKDAVAQAILELGIGGSPEEQPVCTLNRYIRQSREELPEHAFFVILSDEDDTSSPADCLASQSVVSGEETEGMVGEIVMKADTQFTAFRFDCTQLNDKGEPTGEVRSFNPVSGVSGCPESGPCVEPWTTAALSYCDADTAVVSNCEMDCREGTSYCRRDVFEGMSEGCDQPFEDAGVDYESMLDYCTLSFGDLAWGDCEYVPGAIYPVSREVQPLVDVETMPELIDSFRSEADEVFGPNGYAVQLIGFDPSFDCTPQAGQSFATQLSQIASGPANVFPICEDYAIAFQQLQAFANEQVQTEFSLALEEGDELLAVRIVAVDGLVREVDEQNYAFDQEAQVLTIASSFIDSADLGVEVDVAEACDPAVR